MKHSAETRITGLVTKPPRCHQYAGGTVANFTVDVTAHKHTERYQCVAFKQLGSEIENTISPGQIVSVTGYMQTTAWKGNSSKENHQLITNEFRIESAANDSEAPPKPRQVKRRTYGRGARKAKPVDDFRAVAGEPEFNDPVPF